METTVWVLMYMVITCCGGGAFGGNVYSPRWQEMPSEAICEATKRNIHTLSTPTRRIEGVRCEPIPLSQFDSEFQDSG